MAACIAHITTAVPRYYYPQAYTRDFMKTHVAGDRMTSMVLHRIYTQSAIDGRHSVLPDFLENLRADRAAVGAGTAPESSADGSAPESSAAGESSAANESTSAGNPSDEPLMFWRDGVLISPTTGARNARYTTEARRLYSETARKLFAECPDLNAQSVTHVITVSCTGFYAPGPDLDVVHALGLPPSTQRFHIGFMGCYAAFPALRLARALVGADAAARVLIVSVELCTLHLKFDNDTDTMLSGSVFGDGAAAALVCDAGQVVPKGANPPETAVQVAPPETAVQVAPPETASPRRVLVIDDLRSTVTEGGAGDMAWTIGDHGFDMVLSTYVPDIIAQNLDNVLAPIWQQYGLGPSEVDLWAVHPGGRAIVDKVQQGLTLADHQVAASRAVLQRYGNMSSATVLFVLRELLVHDESSATTQPPTPTAPGGARVLGMAFGPGLTVETGLFRLVDHNP